MESKQVIDSLAALAQETRLAAYRLLVQAGPEGVAAGALAEALGVPANTLSFHLRTLAQADLVHCRRDGRMLYYSADFTLMHGLIDYLSHNCCGGEARVCRPDDACPPASPSAESMPFPST